jgi:DnaA family protein
VISASQLALGVHLRDEATLDNYWFAASQGPLRECLRLQGSSRGERMLYLGGPPGSGRSHLLQGCCQLLPPGKSVYLPLRDLRELPPADVLAALEQYDLVALDDIDAICGMPAWEEALFHLYNRARDSASRLLVSADCAPGQLALQLADLRSRLSWGPVFQLAGGDDATLLEILRFRAHQRGMRIDEDLARYIMVRAARSTAQLMAVLDRLDRESLAQKRPLSIPFVKQCMAW